MNTLKKIVTGLAMASIAGFAYAQMSHDGHGMMMDMEAMQGMMMQMMPKDGDAESTKAFKEADMKMMKDMAVPYTGDVDIDFRTKMIPHHQGAIDMARLQLAHGKDPELRKLAEEIIGAQENEIRFLNDWLARKGG